MLRAPIDNRQLFPSVGATLSGINQSRFFFFFLFFFFLHRSDKQKTERVVINFDDHFTCFGGLARCRSTTRLPLRLFLLPEVLLGRAEEPFPFLSYFVGGSVGYTNGINRLCDGFPCFSFGFISNIVGKLACLYLPPRFL